MSIGPFRRYYGPRIGAFTSALGGLVPTLVRAHVALVVWLWRGFGKRLPEGKTLASGLAIYGMALASAAAAIAKSAAGLVVMPFVDIARWRPGSRLRRADDDAGDSPTAPKSS